MATTTTTTGDVSGTTNYQPNRLDQYTSIERPDKSMVTPEYDNVGNQLKVVTETGEWSLVWNAERRPVTWTNAICTGATCASPRSTH